MNRVSPDSSDLARIVTETISIANERFKDPDTGLEPDYMLSFLIENFCFSSGLYTPILNQWGWDNMNYLTFGNGALVLPWTHEDTYAYLTDQTNSIQHPLTLKKERDWRAIVGGIRAGQIIFIRDGGGYLDEGLHSRVIKGGTRFGLDLVKCKMKRPWQPNPLGHNIDGCNFCMPQPNEEVIDELKVFDNNSTPYDWHKLIVPTREFYEKWGDQEYYLRDTKGFGKVLDVSLELARKNDRSRVNLGVHIGYLAGQNIGHLHYHLLEPPNFE